MIPAFIVPVLNRYDLLERCLDSIDYPVENLLVIDNNSESSWAYEPNKHVSKFWHLKMPSNLGVSGSWNLGIKLFPYANYWLIVNNDAWFPSGSLEMFANHSSGERLLLSAGQPPWCAFSLGEDYVKKVGIFDEGLYPAYYEDNDYVRRCAKFGLPVHQSDIPVNHDNSSTIANGYTEKNGKTFSENAIYYQSKVNMNDYSSGEWNLERRRKNGWE